MQDGKIFSHFVLTSF